MRIATPADIDDVTKVIALAFADDPVWGAALARTDGSTAHHLDYWRLFVEGATPQGMVYRSDDDAAVAVFIPPGGEEMSEAQVDQLRAVVERNLAPDAQEAMFALWDRFDESHPQAEPHAYLSLLALRPDLAGHGYGMAHLAADLSRWDAAGLPSYLESTNPRNDARYGRQGYRPIGEFRSVLDDAVVTTMWRPVGG